MEQDFETIFGDLDDAHRLLIECPDFTSGGDEECVDSYRVALKSLNKTIAMVNECHLREKEPA